jgi:hypothetical protein
MFRIWFVSIANGLKFLIYFMKLFDYRFEFELIMEIILF